MPHISGCRTVLTREVIRLGRKCAEAVGIAHRAIQHVRAGHRNIFVEPRVNVGDQLVLVIQAGRLHYEHRAGLHLGPQHVQAVRIREGDGNGCIERQLAFEADGRLNDVWRTQCWTNLLNSLRRLKGGQRSDRRNGGKEVRVCNYILLLNDPIVTKSNEPV